MDKRYWVFMGSEYYPSGGMADLAETFDTVEECTDYLLDNRHDWYQILDSIERKVIRES